MNSLLLINPASFSYNSETSPSNIFQHKDDHQNILTKAKEEFQHLIKLLTEKKISIKIINDTPMPVKPDAIFPNNWFSSHEGGIIVLYPMLASNRRLERRMDIIEALHPKKIIDLTFYEQEGKYLEGTGSLVLGRKNKIAYANLSSRTHIEPLNDFCTRLNYKLKSFSSTAKSGSEIYHTNVIMAIGNKTAVICDEVIRNEAERKNILESLSETHTVCSITEEQMFEFAGNMLLIESINKNSFWIMSSRAYNSLNDEQKKIISQDGELIHISIPTIENIGGGSIRCMLAEIIN